MVETAVTDVVRSTVTTDNPLAALYEIVVEGLKLLAYRASLGCALGNQRLQLSSCCLGCISVVLGCNPLAGCLLVFLRSLVALNHLVEQLYNALLHLLVTEHHTETELAEVLEQRVVEGRTLTLGVGGVRSRRNRS